jgi:hypothetical protein
MIQKEDPDTGIMPLDFPVSKAMTQNKLLSFMNYPVSHTLLQQQKTNYDTKIMRVYVTIIIYTYTIYQQIT